MCSLETQILCQGKNSISRPENMLIHPISITHEDTIMPKTQTCKQEYASAGKILVEKFFECGGGYGETCGGGYGETCGGGYGETDRPSPRCFVAEA